MLRKSCGLLILCGLSAVASAVVPTEQRLAELQSLASSSPERCLELSREALQQLTPDADPSVEGRVRLSMGRALRTLERFAEARDQLARCVSVAEEENLPVLKMDCLGNLAVASQLQGDLERLYRAAREAVGDPGDLTASAAAGAAPPVTEDDLRSDLIDVVRELYEGRPR